MEKRATLQTTQHTHMRTAYETHKFASDTHDIENAHNGISLRLTHLVNIDFFCVLGAPVTNEKKERINIINNT